MNGDVLRFEAWGRNYVLVVSGDDMFGNLGAGFGREVVRLRRSSDSLQR